MWAYPTWEKYGFDHLSWQATQFTHKDSDTAVQVSVQLNGKGKEDFIVHHNVVYTITVNGLVKVDNDVSFSRPDIPLARLGVRMLLSPEFSKFKYYGRGPMENYADR